MMLRAVGLSKVYPAVAGAARADGGDDGSRGEVVLFRGLDFSVAAGEMVAIVGESGTGKSSLLHLLAALDRPTAGEVWVGETNVSGMNARQAAEFRNREVGYVWQFHYLLPEFTALEKIVADACCWRVGTGRRRHSRRRGRGWARLGWRRGRDIGRAN